MGQIISLGVFNSPLDNTFLADNFLLVRNTIKKETREIGIEKERIMNALVYHGLEDIRYESVKDPQLVSDDDLIVKVHKCAICGSDLHIYRGHGFKTPPGFCVGHEAVGEVVETGRRVHRFKTGDIVMVSAAVGCGNCRRCLAGDVALCESDMMQCYGLTAALQGSQAEAVRVPFGDFNVARIPEGLTLNQALTLTDNLPTAYFGCLNAEIRSGSTVAVVGLGPIGLMAVECAFVLGASKVFALDLVPERRLRAEQLGAIALDPSTAAAVIRDATHGRMADCSVEAVGADATVTAAISLVGKGGIVSVIGVSSSSSFPFPMRKASFKLLTFRVAAASSVQRFWPDLIPLIQAGRLHPEQFITGEFPLSQGAEAYRQFNSRANGILKTVLVP